MKIIATILLAMSFLTLQAQTQEREGEEEDYFAKRIFTETYKDTTYTGLEQKNLPGCIGDEKSRGLVCRTCQ